MKKTLLAAVAATLSLAGLAPVHSQQAPVSAAGIAVIPQPVRLVPGTGRFAITPETKIYVGPKNEELRRIGQSLSAEIGRATGVTPPVVAAAPGKQAAGAIHLKLLAAPDTLGAEGYTLSVQPGQVVLAARQPQGLYLGTQTIRQLLPPQRTAGASLPAVEVTDKPRYQWRGMHLDVSRHFFPVEFVKQYIDYLALHKMNTFHWHLTDDQGWRIEIKKYPKLTSVGGFREGTLIGHYGAKVPEYDHVRYGGFYTQEQIKEVVKYAQDRYITVVPEIEMPGHALAALTAYPELSCTGGPFQVGQTWGVYDDIFCAGNDQTFAFLQDVLTEVMPLFPSKIVHIGGDEAPKTRWKTCPKCQARIKAEHLKDEHELQSYFVQRMEKFVNSKGKTIMGWDEILEGGLAPNAAVMSWRGMEGGTAAARQKHQVVMTPGEFVYFDHAQGDPSLEPLSIGGYLPLEKVYAFEPTPKELTAEERKYILGAQANLWTEYIPTTQQAEYMVLPRMSALAEVLWTPASLKNWESFKVRMQPQYQRFAALGANYAKSAFNVRQQFVPDTTKGGDVVRLLLDATGPQIVYTLDGSAPSPSSAIYKGPFTLSSSAVVKATSFENGQPAGKTTTTKLLAHKALAAPTRLASAPNKNYLAQGPLTLVDGLHGSLSHTDGRWLGFLGTDLMATIDLKKTAEVSSLRSTFLQKLEDKILLPRVLEVAVSNDGRTYKTVYTGPVEAAQSGTSIGEVKADWKKTKARFVRVTAKNAQPLAPGTTPQDTDTWLFADELVVE
ncbi:family 20 glycosylhydrolase [Hymenobacter ginsengisoli]|uniref:beta-N-acetylhexosaminidase n=1 Tax=Hymenobacter ginsengisoli TaxID=1051626 RepID=A0ABP8QBK0_9BACT|nr:MULTISPECIES: family 20 glycosylhydrolase [unclassified Hymenobacter]MBO2031391.1 family 20 glycosylhydrolase [Hymenobacter sp. BT559]